MVQKNLFILDFKKFPGAFLITVLLVLLFEGFSFLISENCYIGQTEQMIEQRENLITRIKNEISQVKENNFGVIAFGDSYGNCGIICKAVKKETSLDCFNFSTNGRNSVFNSFSMMRNYLKATSQKPKFMVISFNLYTYLLGKPKLEYSYEFLPGNFDIFVRELGFDHTVKCLIPTLRAQEFFLQIVQDPFLLFQIKNDKRKRYEVLKSKLTADLGFISDLNEIPYSESEDQIERARDYQFSIDPFAYHYLDAMLELAHRNEIKVLYVMPTRPKHIDQLFEESEEAQRYRDFVDSLRKRYSDLIILDFQKLLEEKQLYQDPLHLNKKGSDLLSTLVSQKINELQ